MIKIPGYRLQAGRMPIGNAWPKWIHAMAPIGEANMFATADNADEWLDLLLEIGEHWKPSWSGAKSRLALVRKTHRLTNNRMTFCRDLVATGGKARDQWQSIPEIVARKFGDKLWLDDCEGFATVKFHVLRLFGFEPVMLLVWATDAMGDKFFHAVVAVEIDGKTYVLDHNHSIVMTAAQMLRSGSDPRIMLGVSEWHHVRKMASETSRP